MGIPDGIVSVHANCPSGFFGKLKMDEGLGRFSDYSSIVQKLEDFEQVANKRDGKVTLAIAEPDVIIGYNICSYPGPEERWSALGDLMYETAAVEVSRNYRGLGIAARIMEWTLSEVFFESRITYMTGYSWHWDLKGTGLTGQQYRQMMIALYSPFGFQEIHTNEPNITLLDENIMMIRIGSGVSADDHNRFKYLRFGIEHF